MTQHPVRHNAKVWLPMWEYALKVEDLPAFAKHFMTEYESRDEYLAMIKDQKQTNTQIHLPATASITIFNIYL